jgi:hypothetical protein
MDFSSDFSTFADYSISTESANVAERTAIRPRPARIRPSASSLSALPGVAITAEVSASREQQRTLAGIFWRLQATKRISPTTYQYAQWFVRALPRDYRLPTVSPDGDGGLQMAWEVPNSGRTLITLNDSVICGVAGAGTPGASYLDDVSFDGVIGDAFLAIIPK